ncbi:MAG: glycosyltransferase [Candidatus Microsaccharimonas sp.]
MSTVGKKKTILLIRNVAKTDFGGAETYPVSLAKILKDNGFAPIVITRSQKLLQYTSDNNIASYKGWWWSRQNWSGRKTLLFPVYILWQVALTAWYASLILKTRADILHIQSKDDFIAGTFAARILGKKVVWTDHMDLRYVFENVTHPFRNPVGKFVLFAGKFADHIILISENEYRLVTGHLRRASLKKQLTIVKNGVIDHYSTVNKKRKNKQFTFCLASRVVTNKGIGEAINAFLELEKMTTPDAVRLAIYGDGPEINRFKKAASASKNITFYGHQANAIEKVAESDVYILPSYQEGFSIALLEASMLGKAIIASNVDSNPEIIHDKISGILIPPRDVKSLSEAMYKMLTEPEQKLSMEKKIRDNFEKHFNLTVIVEKEIIPLYTNNEDA